jgi:hypothetical protein
MPSRPNLKWFAEWNGCDIKGSRRIWSIMWNRTDDRRWCHDLIRGALCIGTDVKECCYELIWNALWIGRNVTGIFTNNLNIMWIRSDDRGRYHDLIWGDMWTGTNDIGCCHDQS